MQNSVSSNFLRHQEIKEIIHLGKVDESSLYAEIDIDIIDLATERRADNLLAIIDSGATHTCVSEWVIGKLYESLENFIFAKSIGAGGSMNSRVIPDIGIRLQPLFKDGIFIPMPSIRTFNISPEEFKYDAIIGVDILNNCEFIYNGLSRTYILKYFHT